MMDANGNDEESERLVYYEVVPKLSTFASVKIALDLWRSFVTENEFTQIVVAPALKEDVTDTFIGDFQELSCNSLNEALRNLELPECTKKSIKRNLDQTRVHMIRYLSTLHHSIFGGNLKNYRLDSFNQKWWVWYTNGEINCKRTAMNMISAAELTEVQKFVIMCSYRVVDDVTMIRLPSNLSSFVENLDWLDDARVLGFIYYLKNELHRFPMWNDLESVDKFMATHCLNDIRHSWFEYFWHRVDFLDQTVVAASMLATHDASSRFRIRLLSKMTWPQQRVLLKRFPCHLVLNFWVNDEAEHAFEVWMKVKSEFTVDQFNHLFTIIFGTKLWFERDMKLLIDVWNTADDHLKMNFSELKGCDISTMFFDLNASSAFSNNAQSVAPSAFELMYLFLSGKSADLRRKMMLDVKDKLIFCYNNSSLMSSLLRLCWPDDDELFGFKASVFISNFTLFHGADLINQLKFAELSLMIMVYSPFDIVTRYIVEELLLSNDLHLDKTIFMVCRSKWIDLCEFIDKIWSDDASSSLYMKKQFVLSFVVECSYRLNVDQDLGEFVEIVAPLLEPNQNLSLCKFLSNSQSTSEENVFEKMYLFSYLSWCLDDDEDVDDLRKYLNRIDRGCKWIYLIILLVSIFSGVFVNQENDSDFNYLSYGLSL